MLLSSVCDFETGNAASASATADDDASPSVRRVVWSGEETIKMEGRRRKGREKERRDVLRMHTKGGVRFYLDWGLYFN